MIMIITISDAVEMLHMVSTQQMNTAVYVNDWLLIPY